MIIKRYVCDVIVSIFFYLLAGIVLIQSRLISDANSRLLPQIFAIIIVILSTLLLYKALRNKKKGIDVDVNFSGHKRVFVITILTIAYILLSDIIGFYFITPVFLFIAMWYLKMRDKKLLILIPLIMTLVIYFIFTSIFGLDVPPGKIININNFIRIF